MLGIKTWPWNELATAKRKFTTLNCAEAKPCKISFLVFLLFGSLR
jgi:hypothetical protein